MLNSRNNDISLPRATPSARIAIACFTLLNTACGAGDDSAAPPSGAAVDQGVETATDRITEPQAADELGETQQALATNESWIGMVPSGSPVTTPCAQGWVGLRMDDEDSGNANSFWFYNDTAGFQDRAGRNFSAGGLMHSSSPRRAGGNTWIRYCPTQVSALPRLRFDYAVISASNACPSGSFRFSRRFDNEDSSNHNTSEGDISPNVSSASASGYTVINFCFVPRNEFGGGGTWDSWLDGQIIFSAGNEGQLNGIVANSGTFGTDDEDDSNNNQFSSSASEYTTRMRAIIAGGRNTNFNWATESTLVTIDLGSRSSCDQAYLEQQALRQIQCSYGRGSGGCSVPGWDKASKAYDNVNSWFCMY